MDGPSRRAAGSLSMFAAIAAGLLVLAGCTGTATPTPSPTTSSPSPTVTPTPTPTVPPPPSLQPRGTAADNLPFFKTVVDGVWNSPDAVSGRAYIDALTAAGFDRSAMQVTSDTTTIGDPAESIQFSVRWGDGQCLVGQVGPATGAAVTAVLPAVGDGVCLLGSTRPIDW